MAQLYRPSNGTEGMAFQNQFCDRCAKNPISMDAKNQCNILLKTLIYDVSDKKYPKQWHYTENGPICSSFRERGEISLKKTKSNMELFN